MQFVRRFRIPAFICALAVLVCELVGRPFAEMGISDDGPYILMTRTLADTGHVVYNGWAAMMLGWQLYLGAAFIKLFGFSFSTVRMSTLLVAVLLAFILQRTLVRATISERNATIGTLALVLSPLYLMLSVTFLSDIGGLFAVVLCLYGCLRALQAATSNATIGWICFAVATNAICGTSRQIAWLGILVMVPCTLWLLRPRRRVLIAGAAVDLAGVMFMLWCMHWLSKQPYGQPEHILVPSFSAKYASHELLHFLLELPFLLLPIFALFLPEARTRRLRTIVVALILFAIYILVGIHQGFLPFLEPTLRGPGDWVGLHGIHEGHHLQGEPPIFLNTPVQILLTILSLGGLIGLVASLVRNRKTPMAVEPSIAISWTQLLWLVVPFTIAYTILLIPRASTGWIFDRYALELLLIALPLLLRYYQEQIHTRLPFANILLVGIVAIYGVAVIHNQFSLDRARVAIAAELRAAGVPDTSVDNGFEYDFAVELKYAPTINDPGVVNPPNAYAARPPEPAGTCPMFWYDKTPHINPLYGVSFNQDACYGQAPFAPVHYSRWLSHSPGTLYVVRYTASPKP